MNTRRILGMSLLLWLASLGLLARDRTESLAGLAGRSSHVALVRCAEAVPVTPVSNGLVYTRYILEVQEQIAGAGLAERVTLRVVGGTAGNIRVTVPDAPRFKENGTYLVMLRPAGSKRRLLVTGAAGGVWPARRNKTTSNWEVEVPRRLIGRDGEKMIEPSARPKDSPGAGVWLELAVVRQLIAASDGR